MSDDRSRMLMRTAIAAVFLLIAVLIAADLLTDELEGVSPVHLALEGAVFIAALIGAGLTLRRYTAVTRDLAAARRDAVRWRAEHQSLVQGLSAAIARQFEEWGLTPSEAEIGMLLLKGLSHAEIAAVRGTSERTVREQSRALYRKADLTGRNELSAFFLEDLLPPGR